MTEYEELHKEHFEDLRSELGRNPTWQEMENSYRKFIEDMFDFYRDFLKLDGNLSIFLK